MSDIPKWQYNELVHSGVDYNNPVVVQEYNAKHLQFRDYQKDTLAVIEALSLKPHHSIIDMGCGTGAFTLNAAKYCKKIYAVDVSPAMLDFTRQKANELGLVNKLIP